MKEQVFLTKRERNKTRLQLLIIVFFLGAAIAPLTAIIMNLRVLPENMVIGTSMAPNLTKKNAVLTIGPKFTSIDRFDVISVRASYNDEPTTSNISYVKRVIGLPNETVEIQGETIFINGVELEDPYGVYHAPSEDVIKVELNDEEYFLMGDNRTYSQDSRWFGPFKAKFIDWVALYIFDPQED